MKRLFAAALALSGLIFPQISHAGDIRHTYAGDSTNSFYVDDLGGSVNNGGSDNSYFLTLHDINQSAFGTLLLYSNDGIGSPTVDDGLVDQDFVNPSGIQLFDLSVLPGTTQAGEIGLAEDSPLTPVSFTGSQSGLKVEQVTYTSDNPSDQFVVMEYRVINNSSSPVQARLGLSNDFDVDVKSSDTSVGFLNNGFPMVYQQEGLPLDPTFTTVGVGLVRGALAQYRQEICTGPLGSCAILGDDGDVIRKAFFEGINGQVGDLTGGLQHQDFASTIAANLGTIQPGKATSVVFCYNLAKGANPADGVNNCQNSANNCETFYQNQIDICSNGLINYGEVCDDGNTSINDSCPSGPSGTCNPAFCGDGFVWNTDGGTELCDDGNNGVNDACPSGPAGTCKPAACGDGYVWNTDGGTETCDDGNNDTHDACPSGPSCNCQVARCGDGYIWNENGGTEVCDDGNNDLTDDCPSGPSGSCQPATCGDGFIHQGVEQCDDGNSNTNDACPSGPSGSCQLAFCGDGFVNKGVEVCDTAISGSNCTNNCTRFNSCGNGVVDPGESCDDGNNNVNDNCPDGPNRTCQTAVCGDGFLHTGVEQCDDGNTASGDGCSATCQLENIPQIGGGSPSISPIPACGNGIVEEGEDCDGGFGCEPNCRFTLVLEGAGASQNAAPTSGGCSLQTNQVANSPFSFAALTLLLGWMIGLRKTKTY